MAFQNIHRSHIVSCKAKLPFSIFHQIFQQRAQIYIMKIGVKFIKKNNTSPNHFPQIGK